MLNLETEQARSRRISRSSQNCCKNVIVIPAVYIYVYIYIYTTQAAIVCLRGDAGCRLQSEVCQLMPQLCDWLPVSGSNCVVVFSQVVPNFSTWLHRADEDQKVRNTCPRLLLFPLRAYPYKNFHFGV